MNVLPLLKANGSTLQFYPAELRPTETVYRSNGGTNRQLLIGRTDPPANGQRKKERGVIQLVQSVLNDDGVALGDIVLNVTFSVPTSVPTDVATATCVDMLANACSVAIDDFDPPSGMSSAYVTTLVNRVIYDPS